MTGPGGARGPVAAQNLDIQDIGGLIDALNNMLGRPVAAGNQQVPAVWGLDGAALRGLIQVARNQNVEQLEALMERM